MGFHSGIWVLGSGLRGQGSGYRLQGFEFMVFLGGQTFWCWIFRRDTQRSRGVRPEVLEACSPTSVSGYKLSMSHLDTWTPGHLDTRTPVHLDTCTPGHLNTWTPVHLDTWTPGYLDT
jgi:hypothetical protein